MARDSYCCVVCGASERLVHVWDDSLEDALLCYAHRNEISKVWHQRKLKEILGDMGVKFGDQPMDVNYKDEDFCRDCGIKYPEPWEMTAAMYENVNVKELEAPKEKKDGNDVLKKRTRSNRKF